jgi:hypothetical protein
MIPDVPREKLIEALVKFDDELRDTPEWQGWEAKLIQKYAIEHEGKRYPPKEIIRLATSFAAFAGGDEANGYLARRGFGIVPLRDNGNEEVATTAEDNADPQMNEVDEQSDLDSDEEQGGNFALEDYQRLWTVTKPLQNTFSRRLLIEYPAWLQEQEPDIIVQPARRNGLQVFLKGLMLQWCFFNDIREVFIRTAQVTPDDIEMLQERLGAHSLNTLADGKTWSFWVRNDADYSVLQELAERQICRLTQAEQEHTQGPSFWWVNQGATYKEERAGGFIWAPQKTRRGTQPLSFWLNMTKLKVGDWVFHYAHGSIQAVGHVMEEARDAGKPGGQGAGTATGWQAKIEYFDLAQPIALDEIPLELRSRKPGSGFNVRGRVNQGYLYPVSKELAQGVAKQFAERLPEEFVKAVAGLQGAVVKIAPGGKARFWDECLAGGYICVGWDKVGNLRRFATKEEFRAAFAEQYGAEYKDHGSQISKKANEVWKLMELKPGDLIVANEGISKVLGVGRVREPVYEWREERSEFKHIVHVEWDTSYAKTIPEQKDWAFATVADVPTDLAQVILSKRPEQSNIWLFQSNPRFFDLVGELKKMKVGDADNWMVTSYWKEMKPGDRVIIWQAGPEAGVYATGELTSEPYSHTYAGDEAPWVKADADEQKIVRRVDFEYTRILERPIYKKELLEHPVLKGLMVIKFASATNFRVTAEEWGALELLIPNGGDYAEPGFDEIKQRVEAQKIRLETRTLRRYHLALKTRGFVILSGISGTGKTWLSSVYATAVGAEYLLVPVAPNWNTNEDLLGYFNPITERYHDTPFSRFLRRAADEYARASASGRAPRPYHLVLDEMNLARVEYYFAKFLSAMEVRARREDARLELAPGEMISLPPNLYFVGTVNIDETTHGFADKVYDRAQLIELGASRDALLEQMEERLYAEVVMAVWDAVHQVAPFAFRVLVEIGAYVDKAAELGASWEEALDEQLLQKVLPKMKGVDPRLGGALARFEELTEVDFPLSHAKAQLMRIGFQQHGFASYF